MQKDRPSITISNSIELVKEVLNRYNFLLVNLIQTFIFKHISLKGKTFNYQMKISVRKRCKVFAVYIMNCSENDNKLKLEDIQVLKEFEDIFPEDPPRLPPKRNIELMINLISRVVPTSKYPYRMNIIELTEIK